MDGVKDILSNLLNIQTITSVHKEIIVALMKLLVPQSSNLKKYSQLSPIELLLPWQASCNGFKMPEKIITYVLWTYIYVVK